MLIYMSTDGGRRLHLRAAHHVPQANSGPPVEHRTSYDTLYTVRYDIIP